MNKVLFFLFTLNCVTTFLYSQEERKLNIYNYQLVATIKQGNGDNQFNYSAKSGSAENVFGPGFLYYVSRGVWQVNDRGNSRLVFLNEDLKFLRTIPFANALYSYIDPEGTFCITLYYNKNEPGFNIESRDSTGRLLYAFFDSVLSVRQGFIVVYEDTAFIQTEDLQWYSLILPESKTELNQKVVMLNPVQTKKELGKEGSLFRKGFRLSDSNTLLYKGLQIGSRYDDYLEFYKKHNNFYQSIENNRFYSKDKYLERRFRVTYLGYDVNQNQVWSVGPNEATIFDISGNIIENLGALNYSANALMSVHPSGDLYQSGAYEEIYRVNNVWDLSAKKRWQSGVDPVQPPSPLSNKNYYLPPGLWLPGTVNDSDVRMRLKPSVDGGIVTTLTKGTPLTILEETPQKYKIGSLEAPWYMVRTYEGVQGWVYGAFVDVER